MEYFSHSKGVAGTKKLLREHLREVAETACRYASPFDAGEQAWMAGMLHDLGKYGELFRRRLEGKESGIDHWTAGAAACLNGGTRAHIAPTLAIVGHHIGLQQADPQKLIQVHKCEKTNPQHLRFSDGGVGWKALLEIWKSEVGEFPALKAEGLGLDKKHQAKFMYEVRMLFSALTDADFVCTEAHFSGPNLGRESGPELRAADLLAAVDAEIASLGQRGSPRIQRLRSEILADCQRAAATEAPGVFTLTAPTGSGKTLSALRFAAEHAARLGLRRIIYVAPYLSIFDQTARVWRKVASRLGMNAEDTERYLLEHASLTRLDFENDGDSPDGRSVEARRLLQGRFSENWDAPIVLTTNVQFFESLFANRPGKCRKLHRIAGSVILCDEIQTLPQELARPTLATLSRLCEPPFGSTVVFMTATQPAFGSLDGDLQEDWGARWQPREIVSNVQQRFADGKRYATRWPNDGEKSNWAAISDWIADLPQPRQALVIVNVKRHAQELMEHLRSWATPKHISTSMCPAHRKAVLDEVTQRLHSGEELVLVSTQCVEAGVDLDFPNVARAIGPLDSIAQAAGRCNRNGKSNLGNFRVFIPEEEALPPDAGYSAGTQITKAMLRGKGELDLDDPSVFDSYFRELYDILRLPKSELRDAIVALDFPTVAQKYRLIKDNTLQVIVPYDSESFRELDEGWRERGVTAEWVRKARPYTVNHFQSDGRVADFCQQVMTWQGKEPIETDWWILGNPDYYLPDVGLQLPKGGGMSFHVED
jgi:CRISPR-associated endonuclease/helicase Cas3